MHLYARNYVVSATSLINTKQDNTSYPSITIMQLDSLELGTTMKIETNQDVMKNYLTPPEIKP